MEHQYKAQNIVRAGAFGTQLHALTSGRLGWLELALAAQHRRQRRVRIGKSRVGAKGFEDVGLQFGPWLSLLFSSVGFAVPF